MDFLIEAMSRPFPKLNTKAHDFEDVQRITRKEHINLTITEYEPNILGYFCTRKTPKRTKRYIVINSLLDDVDRTFIGLHELGHFYLHVPVSSRQYFYCKANAKRTQSKHDAEANAFALIAMIPLWMLIDLETVNFEDIDPKLIPYLKKRAHFYEQYGF
jgi:Zn-dependent peptidase ImmA (M78 family)